MKTRIVELDQTNYDETLLDEPAKIIKSGGLVAFPTETVYGIAINLENNESIQRLYNIKQRPIEKDITTHIASRDDLPKYAKNIPGYAQRLVRKLWPGPLTIILPSIRNDTIGLRYPSNKIAQTLIKKASIQLGAPSANISGEPPCVDGKDVVKAFEGKVDYIISAGPTQYKSSSTIVKAVDSNPQILREGAIPRELIDDLLYKMILFVCTGNTCRSPLAEALLKLKWKKEGKPQSKYRAISSGLAAVTGIKASTNAVTVAEELGATLEDHISQPLTISMVEESDTIYVMTREHKKSILEWLPELERTVFLLDPEGDIEDPIGSNLDEYRKCAQIIKKAIDEHIKL